MIHNRVSILDRHFQKKIQLSKVILIARNYTLHKIEAADHRPKYRFYEVFFHYGLLFMGIQKSSKIFTC